MLAGVATAAVAALGARSSAGRKLLPVPIAAAVVAGRKGLIFQRQRRRSLEAEVRDQEQTAERLSSSLRHLVSDLRMDEVLRKIMTDAQAALLGREIAVVVASGDGMQAYGSSRIPESSLRALERWAAKAGSLDHARTEPELRDISDLAELAIHPDAPLGALSVAPLVFRGEGLGAVIALTRLSDAFLPKEVDLLELYAAEAALALGNARLVERLEALARHDSLTGLLNHREFQETLAAELETAQRRGGVLSVVMIDLDGFKQVNDEYGHAEGDRVLRMVAEAMTRACRGSETAARIGGDEFALILPDRTAEEADAMVLRLEREIRAFGVGTGVSWGVADWPKAGPSQSLLLFNADRALYETKVSRPAGLERRKRPGPAQDPGHAQRRYRHERDRPSPRSDRRPGAGGRRQGLLHAQPLRDGR